MRAGEGKRQDRVDDMRLKQGIEGIIEGRKSADNRQDRGHNGGQNREQGG